MASREKRTLAPSRNKKANNDSSSLPAAENSRKKTKSLTNPRAQLAREILEAVATGSQLPAKLEANLPRRRALQTALKRKQKAKKTLIKVKQKAPIKTLKRIADVKKILKRKRKTQHHSADSSFDNSTESEETKSKYKTTKRSRASAKDSEVESEEKISPRLGRRAAESVQKSARNSKILAAQKRNDSKEREVKVTRSLSKEPEELKVKAEPSDTYEVTIEEVIASSMLIEPVESIKIDGEVEGEESASESELKGKRIVRNPLAKRGLRNGKLRQSLRKAEIDSDRKRSSSMSEASMDISLEAAAADGVTIKSEPSDEVDSTENNMSEVQAGPDLETNNNGCENTEGERIAEIGPTLRSKTKARTSDSGSDTKSLDTKSPDAEAKADEAASTPTPVKPGTKSESEVSTRKERIVGKLADMKGTPGPPTVNSTPKSRRSSLNIDMRRSSIFPPGTEKVASDGSSKNQIDEMINKIKLTIAKSIESKIYKPDNKGLILGKSFELPKMEDIIAPLSNEAMTSKLEKEVDDDKTNVTKGRGIGSTLTKKELKTEDTENSVPKVADTAKEIEKLVMGDIEPADSQPSKKSESSSDNADPPVDVPKDEESKPITTPVSKEDESINKASTSTENLEDCGKGTSTKQPEESKKSTPVCATRKSTRATAGKSSSTSEKSSEIKKPTNTQETSKEPEVKEELVEKEKVSDASAKSVDDETESEEVTTDKTPEIESSDVIDENSTTVSPVEDSKEETLQSEKSPVSDTSIENIKMDTEESVESEKCEETLESLSREVERLVEEDNEKTVNEAPEIAENEVSSDMEMRLMIDEEVPESVSKSTEESKSDESKTVDNDEGCDQTSFDADINDVQKDKTTVESMDIAKDNPEVDSTPISSVESEIKLKDISTEKPAETAEVEEQNRLKKEENRRVLRTRGDKQKKVENTKSTPTVSVSIQEKSETKVIKAEDAASSEVPLTTTKDSTETSKVGIQSRSSVNEPTELTEPAPVIKVEVEEQPEPQYRTRRSREVKKLVQLPVTKNKRGPKKQEAKKVEQQHQNKEETLLDNEVAKINENDRSASFLKSEDSLRGVSVDAGQADQQKIEVPEVKNRSKSENDVRSTNLSSDILKTENAASAEDTELPDAECKSNVIKDSDEASTSGESSSSVEKIMETPEDRAKKEDILRQLGLESWERVKERKAKKEQQYTGTLKTIIRLQKEKEGKKRSRSPLKMVLKQQGRMDGEESIDYYTIQKEFGTSGLGDSSSGANRKLPTNPRHSCDEDNEDAPLKDRQSLVIPEKSSSFSIHPGRLCADNCCYCHGKFGSLDTPMHLAQMKSDERRKKILENEVHLTKDSCLCDACYRHVDRKANMSPTMQLKPQRQHRQSIMGCMARNCSESARHHVKRRWLLKIKPNLRNQVDINWDSTQHNLMTFCGTHYSKIERFLTCTLCKRRLTRNYTYPLGLTAAVTEDLNNRLRQQGIPALMVVNTYVCRLCRYFTKLHLKHSDFDSMTDNNKEFHKKYRKKLLYYHDIDVPDSEEEEALSQMSKNKEKNRTTGAGYKKTKCNASVVKLSRASKSPDGLDALSTTASEKSSPEPPKTEGSEIDAVSKDENASIAGDGRFAGIEGAIEKLKKRKALDTSGIRQAEPTNNGSSRDVVEILAMDKEVTLTRLPKRPRLANSGVSNDITPVVQRLGANPSISVRTLFPGEEEMNLHANVEFNNVREVTPQGWEKCATMIQYDRDTKLLWQELQRPYGNQSSFLRHLILLEKYYRSGDLILAPNASRNAINYSTSVQNRLISYEGPEKLDEVVIEPLNSIEYNNSRRLSGGYILENREQRPSASTSSSTSSTYANVTNQLSKMDATSRVMKLTPGVSIIKKPPPNLQRLNLSGGGLNGSAKRKESIPMQKAGNTSGNPASQGGKVFQLTEPDFKRLQNLKRQKQIMNERQATSSPNSGSGSSCSPPSNYKTPSPLAAQYQKAQLAAQSQFQKHLRMQQEMLNQRSRGDFEPIICDIRTQSNENTPTQNLINNLNLPKSIQVTTKAPTATSTPIPILPKIPKSLTVIPQTVARNQDK